MPIDASPPGSRASLDPATNTLEGAEIPLTRHHLKHEGWGIVAEIRRDAEQLVLVELTGSVAERAGELLLVHALQASDAVQLASYMLVKEEAGAEVTLIAYDDPLIRAAGAEGVQLG